MNRVLNGPLKLLPLLLLLSLLISGCQMPWDPNDDDDPEKPPITGADQNITGNWTSGGGEDADSFRNDHYEFTVTGSSKSVTFSLATGVAGGGSLYLIDSNRISLGNADSYPYNVQSLLKTLEPGSYTLIACARTLGASGAYTLEVEGSVTDLTKVVTNSYSTEDTGEWSYGVSNSNSFRSRHYNFTVNEDNTYVDLELTTGVAGGGELTLLDHNRNPVATAGSYPYGQQNIRSQLVNAGEYEIIVSARTNGGTGVFVLELWGKATDLVLQDALEINLDGAWTSGGGASVAAEGNVHYLIDVTEDNTYLDVVLESAVSGGCAVHLIDESTSIVLKTVNSYPYGMQQIVAEQVNIGTYRIIAATRTVEASGIYKIRVFGKGSSFFRAAP